MRDDFVRIPVSDIMMAHFFFNGKKKYTITNGLDEHYKCTGVIQSPDDGRFYFLFKKGNPVEGSTARNLVPTFKTNRGWFR